MSELIEFIEEINSRIGIVLPQDWQKLPNVKVAQRFLQGVNRYFFQTHKGIGTTQLNGEELKYFSEFHKFWKTHHRAILNARINKNQARIAAASLKNAIQQHGNKILSVIIDTYGLRPHPIAQVRFFTANQDFREPPENQFNKYYDDPTRFDADEIFSNPINFLKYLGITRLSQTDKRIDFARNAAKFLLDNNITAFRIAQHFGNDSVKIRNVLVGTPNMGYGLKKANMFIRDMVELGVWPGLKHFEEMDVASDINTMKLALRTRILQTDIPLLSSFLDIFCHQYSYIDEKSANAWRVVWEEWRKDDSTTSPRSPCLVDFLLYRIGREYCKDNVVKYQCQKGHTFYHFGAQLSKCRICSRNQHIPAVPVERLMPCQVDACDLPREDDGTLLLPEKNLLRIFDGVCIFEKVCQPRTADFQIFDPPKEITGSFKCYRLPQDKVSDYEISTESFSQPNELYN